MGISQPRTETLARTASGIEAGVVGGLAMLAILISESLWNGRVWWEIPNLFGSTFYGPRAFRSGASMATLSGVALHFVITGTIGGLFGLAFGGIQKRGRLLLLGLLASVGWYNLANAAFWPVINPWVLLGSPRPATVVSHVLLGACLGYMGQRQRLASCLPLDSFVHPVSAHPALVAATAEPGVPPPAQAPFVEPPPPIATSDEASVPSGPELLAAAVPDPPSVPGAPGAVDLGAANGPHPHAADCAQSHAAKYLDALE